jgi:hypothetical protein
MVIPPVTFFWLGGLLAFLVIAREWRRYYKAALKVRSVAQAEGGDWPFTRDPKYVALFTYAPKALLDSSDTERLRTAKQELLALRIRMWRVVTIAISFEVAGVVLAIGWSIASGIMYER